MERGCTYTTGTHSCPIPEMSRSRHLFPQLQQSATSMSHHSPRKSCICFATGTVFYTRGKARPLWSGNGCNMSRLWNVTSRCRQADVGQKCVTNDRAVGSGHYSMKKGTSMSLRVPVQDNGLLVAIAMSVCGFSSTQPKVLCTMALSYAENVPHFSRQKIRRDGMHSCPCEPTQFPYYSWLITPSPQLSGLPQRSL